MSVVVGGVAPGSGCLVSRIASSVAVVEDFEFVDGNLVLFGYPVGTISSGGVTLDGCALGEPTTFKIHASHRSFDYGDIRDYYFFDYAFYLSDASKGATEYHGRAIDDFDPAKYSSDSRSRVIVDDSLTLFETAGGEYRNAPYLNAAAHAVARAAVWGAEGFDSSEYEIAGLAELALDGAVSRIEWIVGVREGSFTRIVLGDAATRGARFPGRIR